MALEKVEFEFPHDEGAEDKFEIEVEEVEGRENVLEKDKKEKVVAEVETEVEEEEVEIIDDTPKADQNRKFSPPPEQLTEDELENYSDKVKKRLRHFSKGYLDERRVKEKAIREKEEAISYAQKVTAENKELQGSSLFNRATIV